MSLIARHQMASTSKMRRSESKITISSETIVELSKSVLLPIQCDTMVPTYKEGVNAPKLAPCGQKISCWKAFHKVSMTCTKNQIVPMMDRCPWDIFPLLYSFFHPWSSSITNFCSLFFLLKSIKANTVVARSV